MHQNRSTRTGKNVPINGAGKLGRPPAGNPQEAIEKYLNKLTRKTKKTTRHNQAAF